jgi:hypothetical protein
MHHEHYQKKKVPKSVVTVNTSYKFAAIKLLVILLFERT